MQVFRKSIWKKHTKKQTGIWTRKPNKSKRSIWVLKNKPKKSIWVSKSSTPQYRTTYNVYQMHGNRARKVKTFRDEVDATTWIRDKQIQYPYNAYKISPVSRRKGWL